MQNNEQWSIVIGGGNLFNGFAPAWYKNSYAFYGNRGHLNDMTNIDLRDPNVITQGPGAADLTAGDENGAVTTLITSILKTAVTSNVSYAIGGALLQQLSATAVTNAGNWPHTISGSGTVTGCDVCHYRGKVLYSYNDSALGGAGIQKGNIGAYDVSGATFDDDYWTTALGGTQLEDAVHYMIVGGDNVAYCTNGQYVAKLDNTSDDAQALDFHDNSVTVSLSWNFNRVLIAVNRPNVSGSNFNQSAIYTWNGTSSSWEGDPIEVSGEIGAIYTKNGRTFVWWKGGISTGGYIFGYISGGKTIPLRSYKGSLPNQAQVGEYEGFITWISSNKLMLWGAEDNDLPVNLFQYISPKRATMGAFAAPFGTPLLSSYAGANFSLAKASGYTVSSDFFTKAFKVNGPGYTSQIDEIYVEFETLATGAKVDTTLYYNKSASNQVLTQIAYSAADPSTVRKIWNKSIELEDFQLKFNFANGSITNPVKIRSIMIKGHYVPFD